ncbi:DUF6809 family protein [Clostridium carboxidivorans]|nr:DUF6809 family protein [Clostridium carboxidivorans]
MNNNLKKVINGAMELAYQNSVENDGYRLDQNEELKKADDKISDLLNEIKMILPEEKRNLITELEDAETNLICMTMRNGFKLGVVSGFTQLEFLKEYGVRLLYL